MNLFMNHFGQILGAFFCFIALTVFITVSSHNEKESKKKWNESFKTTEVEIELVCNISSTYRSFWYSCSAFDGISIGQASFVELASLDKNPITPESRLKIRTKMKLVYSLDFICVINPFSQRTTILNLIEFSEDACLKESATVLNKIKANI